MCVTSWQRNVSWFGVIPGIIESGQVKTNKDLNSSSPSLASPTSTVGSSGTSTIAAPLTKPASPPPLFSWTAGADAAVRELKRCFTSAPVLINPDPSRHFMVEVDTSDSGIGAVLSQHSASDQKLHPCSFFSHCLSPAERNYDVGALGALAGGS